jgi:uncharacterized membrane protein YgcG
MLAAVAMIPITLNAAELNVAEGVVVKFGADAQLVVRDKLTSGKGVVLTSLKDDATAGQSGSAAQVPASGDWQGVRVERSANVAAEEIAIRYAGAQGGAALHLRGYAPKVLNYLQITDSTVGLRLLDGVSPTIDGGSFLRNGIGLDADGNSKPVLTNSQFSHNASQAILNRTPSTVIQAIGNWWGHASGPKDAAANPEGQGDAVSSGVNYGSWLTATQLINPFVRLPAPVAFTESNVITVLLGCVNATEYRIAETDNFTGVDFKPMATQASVTLSPEDGAKQLYVQYRDASGKQIVANLAGGVVLDAQGPVLSIQSPASGSVVNHTIGIEGVATDLSGIAKVEFYVNDVLQSTRATTPYTFTWDTDVLAEGEYALKLVAYDKVGHSTLRVQNVTVSHAPPPPDTEGPTVSNIRIGGVALISGVTLGANSTLSLEASDRSGIGRVDLLLDAQVVGSAVSSSNGSTYSTVLDIATVANGAHTLSVRVYDSLNNVSAQDFAVTVAHALPNAPSITQPAAAVTIRDTTLTVLGTASAGKQVQVYVNGVESGAPVTAAGDGRFSAIVTLTSGANQITAKASDAWGTSAASNGVTVTVDDSVPQTISNLVATVQSAGKIHLVWTRSSDPSAVGTHLYRATSPFASIGEATRIAKLAATVSVYDDLPFADGTYYYRAITVNALGTPSAPSNQVQGVSDNTLPFAQSITYAPTGKTDPVTGRIGQGLVNLVVVVNEALSGTPYLSIVPQGGAPITVDLAKQDETHYSGSFQIGADTLSGVASVLFSARDLVGNRGTEVKNGASLNIDTQGPIVTGISIAPTSPIKADAQSAVTAAFTLSKAVKSGTTPSFGYLLSGAVRSEVALAGITNTGATTWQGVVTLPSDAGLGQPENLTFTYRGIDDLDNVSTKISAANRFQVYQGELPPLDVPLNLKAEAKPGGKIRLTWGAVDGATAYQIYRQAPGEAALAVYQRSAGTEYLDTTTQDGLYTYAVASVRQSNGQESLSGQSAPVQVSASATAPGAPQNLGLELIGQGIKAAWQPPLGSLPASYNLYRSSAAAINSTDGLTPIKTGIKSVYAVDPSPSPSEHSYAVTSLDSAGNESALSNSAYLNFSLLPVRTLTVAQLGDQQPLISWTPGGSGAAGYDVYVGSGGSAVKLNSTLLTDTHLSDTGFAGGERSYTVVAVDTHGVEMARDIVMPNIVTQVVAGLPLKRGIMNKVQVQVANLSAAAVSGLTVTVKVGTVEHRSASMSLNANETRIVPVIVGGYDTLSNPVAMTTGVEIVPAEGELVRLNKTSDVEVADGSLVVGISPESFTRGGVGKIRLTIENTTEAEVELLTANSNGNAVSSELRFKLLDGDGNVLATQSYKQVFGASVITLPSGQTVARIPSGASYTSDEFAINVPAAAPNTINVRLEVDKIHYHLGQADHVAIKGTGSEKSVSLADTSYFGEITSVSPQSSFGDVDIVISGRAVDRSSSAALSNTPLKLILNQQGFERAIDVLTDASGAFTHVFKPTATDAGLYQVAAIHPAITDRPVQNQFVINRVSFGPTPFKLTIPRNYAYSVDFRAKAGTGTSATGIRLAYEAEYQPSGSLPEGISVKLPAPINIAAKQNLAMPVVVSGDNTAQPSGAIVLKVFSNESGDTAIGSLRIDYVLSEAKPVLNFTPSYIETGLAQGGSDIEALVIENKGLSAMNDVVVSLTSPDGSPAPAWVSLGSAANLGSIAVGEKKTIDIGFAPGTSVAEGIYEFRVNIQGSNIPTTSVKVFASITQSGVGNVLFKASDMYTATLDKQGHFIPGLAGARVVVQNEAVASQRYEIATDSLGEAYFQNLPAGRYTYRVSASNHQELGGRFQVKPGITLNQGIFLDYNLITVEWSVNEVTIDDRYEVTLKATFETDVPAPVVLLEPASINLPSMKAGDVYYGQLNLTNYGLVRADNVAQTKPKSDAFFKFEFLVDIPTSLEAKQRVSIPYRVVALQSLDQPSGTASGGGCYSYSNLTRVGCSFVCANGIKSNSCGSSSYWYSASNSTCTSGTGGTGGSSGGWSGGGGGSGGGSPSYTYLPGMPTCVNCDGPQTKPPCSTCGAK